MESAGTIKYHLEQWGKLTSDPQILNIVGGCKIEFDQPPLSVAATSTSKAHFQITFGLFSKVSPGAHPFIRKLFSFACE